MQRAVTGRGSRRIRIRLIRIRPGRQQQFHAGQITAVRSPVQKMGSVQRSNTRKQLDELGGIACVDGLFHLFNAPGLKLSSG